MKLFQTKSTLALLIAVHITLTTSQHAATEDTTQCDRSTAQCTAPTNATSPPRRDRSVRVQYLFATPMIRTKLSAFVADVASFNTRLGAQVLRDYDDYLADMAADMDAEERNDDFFAYQVADEELSPAEAQIVEERVAGMEFRNSREFALLEAVVRKVARHMAVEVLGLDVGGAGYEAGEHARRKSEILDGNLQSWAAVHYERGAHAMHYHEGAALSAVYYVRVPEKAGRITLYDPRGPRPPFEHEIEIEPAEGDLIMFPGWLAHSVGQTGKTEGARISIPFNLNGKWEESSAVSGSEDVVEVEDIEELEEDEVHDLEMDMREGLDEDMEDEMEEDMKEEGLEDEEGREQGQKIE